MIYYKERVLEIEITPCHAVERVTGASLRMARRGRRPGARCVCPFLFSGRLRVHVIWTARLINQPNPFLVLSPVPAAAASLTGLERGPQAAYIRDPTPPVNTGAGLRIGKQSPPGGSLGK